MDSRSLADVFRQGLSGLAVLEKLPVAVFVVDACGRPYFANRQAQRLLGRGINPHPDADQLAEIYQAYVAGTNDAYPADRMPIVCALSGHEGSVDDMEIRHPEKTIQIEVWASPVPDENGVVEFAIAAFVDITARKKAEAELRLARQLAEAIASAPTFEQALETSLRRICEVTGWALGQVWLPDATGRQLVCGAAWYAAAPALDALHQSCREVVLPFGVGLPGEVWATRAPRWEADVTRDRGFVRGALAAEAGVVAGVAVPVLAGEDVVAVIEFFVVERRERDERFLNLVSTVAAQLGVLMSQKQAEDALRASEAEFRTVADTASDGIVSAGADGLITYVNRAAEAMFGHSVEEARGQPLTVLIPERFHEAHRQGLARYLRTGEARILGRPVDVFARRRDGSEFPAQLSLASWGGPAGVHFTAIVRDVCERQQAEQAVRDALTLEQQATGRLRALDGMKDTLLHTVSHDLRNPIAAVLATTCVLAADADGTNPLSPEVRASLVGNIAKTARRMERLLADLVDSDRLRTVEPHRRLIDVGALVAHVLAESDLERHHPVHADIEPVEACVDPGQVERVAENLILNEIKHLPAGVPVWVRVAAAADGVIISVEDAGPGVPAELRESIFEPFRRGPGAPTGGLGIGLSLVARFAQLHGGRAWVEDRPGGGAAFRVLLPGGDVFPRR